MSSTNSTKCSYESCDLEHYADYTTLAGHSYSLCKEHLEAIIHDDKVFQEMWLVSHVAE